jgi:translation elongation factor P/translation initiation factor 5A
MLCSWRVKRYFPRVKVKNVRVNSQFSRVKVKNVRVNSQFSRVNTKSSRVTGMNLTKVAAKRTLGQENRLYFVNNQYKNYLASPQPGVLAKKVLW